MVFFLFRLVRYTIQTITFLVYVVDLFSGLSLLWEITAEGLIRCDDHLHVGLVVSNSLYDHKATMTHIVVSDLCHGP
jgi:hypothetical protein